MELFDRKSINKFFNLFCDKKGYIPNGQSESEKEIFVRRTVNKWFSDKYIIFYNPDGYKEYLYIKNIQSASSYGSVKVHYLNYGNPAMLDKVTNYRYAGQELYYGEWCTNDFQHLALLEVFKLPKQQFTFVQIDTKNLFKNKWASLDFSEILEKYGEKFVVESTTYNKAFKIAKELETKEVKVYQI